MSIQEIEQAIERLPAAELEQFARWFEEFAADRWDQQIEADIRAGHLDAAGNQADDDYLAGRCTPL